MTVCKPDASLAQSRRDHSRRDIVCDAGAVANLVTVSVNGVAVSESIAAASDRT
jgi:hypothetical protein